MGVLSVKKEFSVFHHHFFIGVSLRVITVLWLNWFQYIDKVLASCQWIEVPIKTAKFPIFQLLSTSHTKSTRSMKKFPIHKQKDQLKTIASSLRAESTSQNKKNQSLFNNKWSPMSGKQKKMKSFQWLLSAKSQKMFPNLEKINLQWCTWGTIS